MATTAKYIRQQVLKELDSVPTEFHPFLLQMLRAYRKSVTLKPAAESFAQGWREARGGQTRPIRELWEGMDGR